MSELMSNTAKPVIEELLLQKLENSLKNLRVADVELFITAAHMKNLGKSAKLHHLSQSAASTAVQRVETAFNVSLCTHEKRKFCLTREGQILFPRLEKWIHQLRKLVVKKDEIPIRLVTTRAISQVAVPALFSIDNMEFTHKRLGKAYAAVLHDEADMALVLDNDSWSGVIAAEVGTGNFQLYSRDPDAPLRPVLLPEDQIEVLALQQSWKQIKGYSLPIKSRIPSWSLIANICAESDEVGFLPDFLAKKYNLHPVTWQTSRSKYRILAIHKNDESLQVRFAAVIKQLQTVFH